MEPLPRVFDMLQYFQTFLHSMESLWSSQQDEVCFMVGGTAGGLRRHQTWSLSWILPRIRNQVETARIGFFFFFLCIILSTSFTIILREVEKNAFLLKNGLTTCSLKFIRLLRVVFSSQQRLNRPAVNAVQ